MERYRDDNEENEILRISEPAAEDDVPKRWRPSQDTIEAISQRPVLPSLSDTTSASIQGKAFREEMAAMTKQERGTWGERAVIAEAQSYGHRILSEHADKSNTPGYDCVSWDARTHTLHIWEAKNRSATNESDDSTTEYKLGALDIEKRLASAKRFMKDLPVDDPDRQEIVEAVEQNHVQCHIRLGPDTDISFAPLDKLEWDSVDVKQYNYAEMLRVR